MGEYRRSDENKIDEMEKIDLTYLLRDVWQGVKKFWWLVLLLAVLFAVKAYFTTTISYQPQYVASATMTVTAENSDWEYVNVESASQMEKVFPYILTSGVLSDVVAKDLGVDVIPGTIEAKADEGTNFFTLKVTAADPQMAYNILQSVIKNYPQVAEFVIGNTKLEILDETGIPSDTGKKSVIRGSYRRGAMEGAAIGLFIMAIYIVTRRTVKSRKELRKSVNLEDFGSVPYIMEKKRKKSKAPSNVILLNERVPQAYLEAMRKLRIKVMKEMEKKGYRSLLVTSSVPGEGKTTLAVNLAIAFAKQGKNVVLVDCDPRNPSVALAMNEEEKHPGIGAFLREEVNFKEAITSVNIDGTRMVVLYGGEPSEKDSRLLGTESMKRTIERLEDVADLVILDTPPSELLADASTLAKFVDAALYVVKYDTAKIRQIREGIHALSLSGTDIIGYVFNADKENSNRAMNYGYNYGYSRYGGKSNYGGYGHYLRRGRKDDNAGRVMKD